MLLVFALCSTILSAQTGAQSPDLIAQEALNASYADALNEIGRINRPKHLPVSFSSDLADVNLKIYSADKPYNLPYENPKIHVAGAPYLIRNISLQETINLVAGTYYVLASKSGYLDHIQVFEVPAPAAIPIFLYPEGIVSILKTKKKVLAPNTLKLSRIDSTGNLLSWTIAEPQYRYIIDRSENGADWQNGLISFSSGVRQWKDPDGKPVQYYRIYGVKDDRISLPLMASLSQTAKADDSPLLFPDDTGHPSFVPYDDPPAVIERILPVYPDLAKQNKIRGTVVLEVEIFKDGSVGRIIVKRSIPGLDDAAIDAVRKWKFQPGKADGQAIDVFIFIPVEFSLD